MRRLRAGESCLALQQPVNTPYLGAVRFNSRRLTQVTATAPFAGGASSWGNA